MKLTAKDIDVDVREATADDVPLLLSFIRTMADFERLQVTATEESLRAALFGEAPAARALLLFVDGRPMGYATYYFTFGTMVGRRGLWLDDLFIDAAYRGKGVGQALMTHLARIAQRNQCARFEWMVLDWNERAVGFYRQLGAAMLDDWRICRLDEGGLARVAAMLPAAD